MTIFAIYFGSMVQAFCETRVQVQTFLSSKVESFRQDYDRSNNSWYNRQYADPENYAASCMASYRVVEVDISGGINVSGYQHYSPNFPEGMRNVTSDFFTITQETYEGNVKVFAEVRNPRAKSHGMTVIIDPNLHGHNIRPVEEYEALMGTFARIKATTNITGYGYATLFFAPESLTNFRVETQMISGNKINWA